VFSWLARIVQQLWREMVGFGLVGAVGVVCDVITFNVVIAVLHAPKVYGSVSGTTIGTVVAYLGNRYWVFRKRDLRQSSAEISLFLLVSFIGLLITAGCVAFTVYVLGLKTLIAANIAQFVVGQVLGSVFRFWAMHTIVFPESRRKQETEPVEADSFQSAGANPGLGGGLHAIGQVFETD
jgi:putative flippase GtrA